MLLEDLIFTLIRYFFDLTSFYRLGQKYKNILVHILVKLKTLKSPFEFNWPLVTEGGRPALLYTSQVYSSLSSSASFLETHCFWLPHGKSCQNWSRSLHSTNTWQTGKLLMTRNAKLISSKQDYLHMVDGLHCPALPSPARVAGVNFSMYIILQAFAFRVAAHCNEFAQIGIICTYCFSPCMYCEF